MCVSSMESGLRGHHAALKQRSAGKEKKTSPKSIEGKFPFQPEKGKQWGLRDDREVIDSKIEQFAIFITFAFLLCGIMMNRNQLPLPWVFLFSPKHIVRLPLGANVCVNVCVLAWDGPASRPGLYFLPHTSQLVLISR